MITKTKQGAHAGCANSLLTGAEARGFEPRMGGKPKPH
jgi:hypothetical protein